MTDRPQGHRGNKQLERLGPLLRDSAEGRPLSAAARHPQRRRLVRPHEAWVTHASLQTSDMEGGVAFREHYRKPILYDECKYEGNIPQGWGNLTAREMTQRFWLGTLSGCYVGHGETYKHPQDILWWAKGGVLHGESPPTHSVAEGVHGPGTAIRRTPAARRRQGTIRARQGRRILPGLLPGPAVAEVRLAGDRPYKLDVIDPWEMTVAPLGTASPGEYTVSAPKPDLVYRFTPYQPGEKLRPEAKITASVTEGLPPLKVKFASAGGTGRAGTSATAQRARNPAPRTSSRNPVFTW